MSARDEVLARVRRATAAAPEAPEPPRGYRQSADGDRSEIVELFVERAGDYRATLRRAGSAEVGERVADVCREHGLRRVGVPADLPPSWLPEGVEAVGEEGLDARELDGLDAALTGCALAIAETGTIVLDGGARQGRRALTLVPDTHICVLEAEQVVGIVPEAVAALEGAVGERRPLTLISGPSATSDIELSRVEGVHGPRTLEIILVS